MGLLYKLLRSLFGSTPRRRAYKNTYAKRDKPRPKNADETSGLCFVIDGDSIVIQGIEIRLAGIDAPEFDHPGGQYAKWHLRDLTSGQIVRAVFDNSQSYTREVATCFLPDGRDLSAEMVKAGFAIDWPKFSGGKYRQYEQPDSRKRMWRADARQKGQWPPKPQV